MSDESVNLTLEGRTVVGINGLSTGEGVESLLTNLGVYYLVVADGSGKHKLFVGKPESLREVTITELDDEGIKYSDGVKEFLLAGLSDKYPYVRVPGGGNSSRKSFSRTYLDKLEVKQK